MPLVKVVRGWIDALKAEFYALPVAWQRKLLAIWHAAYSAFGSAFLDALGEGGVHLPTLHQFQHATVTGLTVAFWVARAFLKNAPREQWGQGERDTKSHAAGAGE